MHLRALRPEEWREYRAVRLRALEDAPDAFGTTHAEALQRDDAQWQSLTATIASGEGSAVFIALDGDALRGLCAVALDRATPGRAGIYQMWVAPEARRTGLGRGLLDSALDWARTHGANTVHLAVTEGNGAAIRLYESAGFRATGEREPLRPGSALHTQTMECRLA